MTANRTTDGQNVTTVHELLREAILRGELPAGHTTTQLVLARDFGVGRTPLREALRMLQREGLVVSEPNRRVRIAGLSSDDCEGLYVMRILLECFAIRTTVPTLATADFAELEGLMAQMDLYQRQDDRRGFRSPHRAFHVRLVAAAGERMTETIAQLFDHAERYRLAYGASTPDQWDVRRGEHRAIVDAAARGDADDAAHQLATHYMRTAVQVFSSLDPEHDLERLRDAMRTAAPGAKLTLD